jgi:hypothetical protein
LEHACAARRQRALLRDHAIVIERCRKKRPLLTDIECADLRTRMGAAGRERVIRHFHQQDMVQKTNELYRELLAGKD